MHPDEARRLTANIQAGSPTGKNAPTIAHHIAAARRYAELAKTHHDVGNHAERDRHLSLMGDHADKAEALAKKSKTKTLNKAAQGHLRAINKIMQHIEPDKDDEHAPRPPKGPKSLVHNAVKHIPSTHHMANNGKTLPWNKLKGVRDQADLPRRHFYANHPLVQAMKSLGKI